jgi:hypothetical protein
MCALGDGDPRRDDVAVHRPVVADIHLVAGGDVARHFPEHDDGFREHLRLDAAVGADREDVIAELDGPFDVALDGQVFATVQLAFDDDRLPYIHDVLLHEMARLCRTVNRSPRLNWRGRLGCSRRLSACRSDCFIAFPHVILRLSYCQGVRGSAIVTGTEVASIGDRPNVV